MHSCKLISNMYLWSIGNNCWCVHWWYVKVVNWFQICIFEVSETTNAFEAYLQLLLWIGFKFVFLKYWKQQQWLTQKRNGCCELVSNLYFWSIGNNDTDERQHGYYVVNWFQICIFELLETTNTIYISCNKYKMDDNSIFCPAKSLLIAIKNSTDW